MKWFLVVDDGIASYDKEEDAKDDAIYWIEDEHKAIEDVHIFKGEQYRVSLLMEKIDG